MPQVTRTIREQVTDQIRDAVVAGSFPHGQPLREHELADHFGVSRGPVRDAFLQLSQEGFLAYQANRGVTVRQPPDSENHKFIVSLRRQIEAYVIRRGLDRLTDENVKKITASLENLRSACIAGEVAAVARTDMAFHQTILESCGGEDFLPIWKWHCSQMLLAYTRLDNYAQVYEEHVAIFDAVRAGKKQAAVAAIKKNIC